MQCDTFDRQKVMSYLYQRRQNYSAITIVTDLVRRETQPWSPFSHICLGIWHPYRLDVSTCHLMVTICLCFILILFRLSFPVSKPMSLLWGARYICFNTARFFFCISGNHQHVFPEESANQIHLSYFYSYFCNAKRNKVSEFAYQIGQFTGIQSKPGSAFRGYI